MFIRDQSQATISSQAFVQDESDGCNVEEEEDDMVGDQCPSQTNLKLPK